jgi:predicted pyridoxine 5'-phosphate oxidase superfamily flavin-nucleotide-binding protein
MGSERLRQLIEGNIAVLVGTADADGVPSCCRAIAITTNDDFDTATVYVPVATSQDVVANIATTRRIAVVFVEPLSHFSVQVKGVTRGMRVAPPSDQPLVKGALDRFADVLDTIGLPRRITHSVAHWPAFAIDFSVEQIFDQTPGPKAGSALA